MNDMSINRLAVVATLHCLSGCALGEIAGMVIGSIFNLPNLITILLAVFLAFIFGYLFSLIPILRNGLPFKKALLVVLAADSLSILTMEIADNIIMAIVPGAMEAHVFDPLFWGTLLMALFVGFWVTVPVNRYLLIKGKGHALVHGTMHHH